MPDFLKENPFDEVNIEENPSMPLINDFKGEHRRGSRDFKILNKQ